MITAKTLLAAQLIARRHAQKREAQKPPTPIRKPARQEPDESPEWRGFLSALRDNWVVAA